MKKAMFKLSAWLGCALILFVVSSCGLKGGARHNAVVGNVALGETLFAIQDEADRQLKIGQITLSQRQDVSRWLLPALQTGRKVAQLTASWPADKPAPPEIAELVKQVGQIVSDGIGAWPDSTAKAALMTKVALAQNAIAVLLLAFTL